jgi:ubiquitin thioesterase protein OTUB1
MKTHVNAYQPFLLEDTVEQYCASQIEPYQVEIEHIGMNALIDALILPAGLAVEILYLDRSGGSVINSHKFERVDNSDSPTFRLLYRPYVLPTAETFFLFMPNSLQWPLRYSLQD